jgi:pyruvate dehydrogenase E1 component alpha subunit
VLTESQFEEFSDAAKAEAEAAVQFAEQSPWPTDEAIFEDVYFEVDRQTEAGRTGKHFFHD